MNVIPQNHKGSNFPPVNAVCIADSAAPSQLCSCSSKRLSMLKARHKVTGLVLVCGAPIGKVNVQIARPPLQKDSTLIFIDSTLAPTLAFFMTFCNASSTPELRPVGLYMKLPLNIRRKPGGTLKK